MDTQFQCDQALRVAELRLQDALNGIDYVEVATPDQLTLAVVFVFPLPGGGEAGAVPVGGTPLTPANFLIEGGVRITGIEVLHVALAGQTATLTVGARGDFSTYTLRLVASPAPDAPPPTGYDPRRARIPFSFKAACPSEFDCREEPVCPPPTFAEPALNYLAKDYASFRRLILDRLSTLLPDWRDRSPADPLVTLAEALAYEADQLSYRQDATATEAYLGTARRRVSLRRHARLLDYPMHDGCNARTWVHLAVLPVADDELLPRGTRLLTRGATPDVVLGDAAALDAALREGPTVFETLHDLRLIAAQNEIPFHTWSDTRCCLPRGATRITLNNTGDSGLVPGDWLLLEEIAGARTGARADADPAHRHVVRLTSVTPAQDPLDDVPLLEVAWSAADALPFPLCLSAALPGQAAAFPVSVARGNLVLADHGATNDDVPLGLAPVPADRPPLARLPASALTFAPPFDAAAFQHEGEDSMKPPAARRSRTFLTASTAIAARPAQARAAITLRRGEETWSAQRDLLSSDRFATEMTVETERDGSTTLRFGDGRHGRRAPEGAAFAARFRTGNGAAGNVGREALARVATPVAGVLRVRNPLPATGGVDPESLEEVRQFAPQAFRRQERAVTTADWVAVAQRHPSVQRAAAEFRWTGSWHTVFVTVDRRGGLPVEEDEEFLADFHAHLERFRLAGYDLEINGPVYVPLALTLTGCVKPGHHRADVKRRLLEVLSPRLRGGGRRGFFHPDEFTFGQPVYLSRLYAAALAVPGVASIDITGFQRFGRTPGGELAAGLLRLGPLEIARCDNDPNFPENGMLTIDLGGGL